MSKWASELAEDYSVGSARQPKALKKKPQPGVQPAPKPRGGGAPPGGGRKTDWTCPTCKVQVYGSRGECFKCGTPKGGKPDPERLARIKDWTCAICGAEVFASRKECFRCNAPRGTVPDPGAAPAPGGRGYGGGKGPAGGKGRGKGNLGNVKVSGSVQDAVLGALQGTPVAAAPEDDWEDADCGKDGAALAAKGLPPAAVAAAQRKLPADTPPLRRLWATVGVAMEQAARASNGAVSVPGATCTPADCQAAQAEELDTLRSIAGEENVEFTGDGIVDVRFCCSADALPDGMDRSALRDLRLRFRLPGKYPNAMPPLAMFISDTLVSSAAKLEVNRAVWTALTTELLGQPALWEACRVAEEALPKALRSCAGAAAGSRRKPGQQKCRDFLRGNCPRGDRCHFWHDEAAMGDGVSDQRRLQELKDEELGADTEVPELFPALPTSELPRPAGGPLELTRLRRDGAKDEEMRRRLRARDGDGATAALQRRRRELPAWESREVIATMIRDRKVSLVSGATGSGKTTQVPQFVLDDAAARGEGSLCSIICTQPRRIAAVSVAHRVAQERGGAVGDEVGYSVRLEKRHSAATRLLFCTTGVLLRRLQSDPELGNVSHVIVDEAHERSIDSDFLLILLKELLVRRSDLRVVVMSATMDAEVFSRYFAGADGGHGPCPSVAIPGRTHPVREYFLEEILPGLLSAADSGEGAADECARAAAQLRRAIADTEEDAPRDPRRAAAHDAAAREREQERKQRAERIRGRLPPSVSDATVTQLAAIDPVKVNAGLIALLIQHIVCSSAYPDDGTGAILVFLPGERDIGDVRDWLQTSKPLKGRLQVLPLHSTLSCEEQQKVFEAPPLSMRKVVLSTDIAETSVTIDDIVFVIDSGLHKETRFDPKTGATQLVQCLESKANAAQRKGRAGRVRPGYCFRMYSTLVNESMQEHQLCEMARAPLDSLLLQARVLGPLCGTDTPEEVLSRAIEPPPRLAVQQSTASLRGVGAITAHGELTSLGYHLSNLPLDARLGKLLLHGVFLRCLDPCLTIAAALSSRSPFLSPPQERDAADSVRMSLSRKTRSDHLTTCYAYYAWLVARAEQREKRQQGDGGYAAAHYLSTQALYLIQQQKRQYCDLLRGMGFVPVGTQPWDAVIGAERRIFELGGRELNQHSAAEQAVKGCLAAALYPQVVHVKYPQRAEARRPWFNVPEGDVKVHPSSVCGKELQFPDPLLVYSEKVKTTHISVRDVTMVPVQTLMLFAVEVSRTGDRGVRVAGWLDFSMHPDTVAVVCALRRQLQQLFAELVARPDAALEERCGAVVAAAVRLMGDRGA